MRTHFALEILFDVFLERDAFEVAEVCVGLEFAGLIKRRTIAETGGKLSYPEGKKN